MLDIRNVADLAAKELDVYARMAEGQLLHYHEPEPGIFIAESPKVVERALDAGYKPVSFLTEKRHIEGEAKAVLQRCPGVPIYTAEKEVLKQLTGFHLTRGLLCVMERKKLPSVRSLCENASRIAVMENVMNPTNVGAIIRSAAALNIEAVILTPGCSDPLYRRASRVSMGTVFQVPWTFFDSQAEAWPKQGMDILRELGFKTVAMALCDDSIGLDDPRLKREEKLAVILGAEGDGLAEKTVADCDYTVRIEMAGGVDSLNVNAAASVAFWELRKRESVNRSFSE